jgi:hypothetical protein
MQAFVPRAGDRRVRVLVPRRYPGIRTLCGFVIGGPPSEDQLPA